MFLDSFPKHLEEKLPELGAFKGSQSLSGGDINQALKLEFTKHSVFVKHNLGTALPQMFEKEAAALGVLAEKSPFTIPAPIATGQLGNQSYLVLEYLEARTKSATFWRDFGSWLAEMHRAKQNYFGFSTWNYMGKLRQENTETENWSQFFAAQRIEPQVRLARDNGYFNRNFSVQIDRLLSRLENLVPQEAPALVHGDLWSGNYLVGPQGEPALIDPALHYGHREADLAMMHLFGGFPIEVFEAYHQSFPLENAWRDRIQLHNLYPVLVHVNLFGGSYVQQAESIVRRYL